MKESVKKGRTLKTVAIIIDILFPLVATITQFPIWVKTSSSATVSGLFLTLLLISILPLMKLFKQWIKSPSAFLVWLILFVLCIGLKNIIDQMIIICFVGLVGNGLGSIIYRIGKSLDEKTVESKEEISETTQNQTDI